jgi:hypothetical protein
MGMGAALWQRSNERGWEPVAGKRFGIPVLARVILSASRAAWPVWPAVMKLPLLHSFDV